jgi:hypothetical protein
MKKSELRKLIIRIYGVYPPIDSSYEYLVRLRSMLFKYGKPKKSYLQQIKKESSIDVPKYEPPPYQPFTIEDEKDNTAIFLTPTIFSESFTPFNNTFLENYQPITDFTENILTNQDFPFSDEDGNQSPTTGSKRILTWS